MSKNILVARLTEVLEPHGFTRRDDAWNRKSANFVDVIALQVSKPGDAVTINIGVLDNDVHAILWGDPPPATVDEAECTVRARIGELKEGKDIWWNLQDGRTGDAVCQDIIIHALPFLTRMHSRREILQWLTDTNVAKRRYPPPIISLGILHHYLGDKSDARLLFDQLKKTTSGAWRARVIEVADRLKCTN